MKQTREGFDVIDEDHLEEFDRRLRFRASRIHDRTVGRATLRPWTRIFLGSAGVSRETIALCPWDVPRYSSVGVSLLLCSALSAIAMYVTIGYTLPGNPAAAALVGITWGGIILTLDRTLFTHAVAPRNHGSVLSAILRVVPRFALALLLGLLISGPLTVAIFQPEVSAEVQQQRSDQIAQLQSQVDSLTERQKADSARVSYLNQQLLDEISGGSTSAPGVGPQTQELKQQLTSVESELASVTGDLNSASTQLSASKSEAVDGLAQRYSALDALEQANPSIHSMRMLFVGLFTIVTLLPACLMLLSVSRRDAYQKLLAAREDLVLLEASTELTRQKIELDISALAQAGDYEAPPLP
jgi:hypothetical protein